MSATIGEEAMRQIEEKGYNCGLDLDGMNRIIKCGVACHVRRCKVVFVEGI